MEVILKQLCTVPGIISGMLCNDNDAVALHTLSSRFDARMLQEVADTVCGGINGLESFSGDIKTIDLRFTHGRILVRPLQGGILLLQCDLAANLQLVFLNLNIAQKKLEAGLKAAPVQRRPETDSGSLNQADVNSAAPPPADRPLRQEGAGVVLTVDSMKASANLDWDQMQENAAITPWLADRLGSQAPSALTRLKLTHRATGTSKTIPIIVQQFGGQDGQDRIALTLAAAELLQARPGDEVVAELAANSGFFNWKGRKAS